MSFTTGNFIAFWFFLVVIFAAWMWFFSDFDHKISYDVDADDSLMELTVKVFCGLLCSAFLAFLFAYIWVVPVILGAFAALVGGLTFGISKIHNRIYDKLEVEREARKGKWKRVD